MARKPFSVSPEQIEKLRHLKKSSERSTSEESTKDNGGEKDYRIQHPTKPAPAQVEDDFTISVPGHKPDPSENTSRHQEESSADSYAATRSAERQPEVFLSPEAQEEIVAMTENVPEIMRRIQEHFPESLDAVKPVLEEIGASMSRDTSEVLAEEQRELFAALQAGESIIPLISNNNRYARLLLLTATTDFSEKFDQVAAQLPNVELPGEVSRFPTTDRPVSAAAARTGALGTAELLGLAPASISVFTGAKSIIYEQSFGWGLDLSKNTVEATSALITMLRLLVSIGSKTD